MPEHTHIPKGKLAPYVELMWYSDEYSPSSNKERVMPQGSLQIIINLGHKEFRHFEGAAHQERIYDPAILAGVRDHHIFLDSYLRITTMGVILRPGAVSALFGIPASEFKNQVVSLEALLGSEVSEMRGKLIQADSANEKFRIIKLFLAHRLDQAFQPTPAIIYSIEQLEKKNGIPSIAEIRNHTGYSRRRFSELFKETVGVTPKQYARICRFQYSLRMICENKRPNWPALALAGGYYDQSHFIHDFKTFAGISPTEYQRDQSDVMNHLPA